MNQLRSLLIGALFLVPLLSTKAQNKVGIKTAPAAFFGGNLLNYYFKPISGDANLSFELALPRSFSLEVGGAYIYKSPLVGETWDLSSYVTSWNLRGYSFQGVLKYYILGESSYMNAFEGPYLGPYYSFAKGIAKAHYNDGTLQTTHDNIRLKRVNYGWIQPDINFCSGTRSLSTFFIS